MKIKSNQNRKLSDSDSFLFWFYLIFMRSEAIVGFLSTMSIGGEGVPWGFRTPKEGVSNWFPMVSEGFRDT